MLVSFLKHHVTHLPVQSTRLTALLVDFFVLQNKQTGTRSHLLHKNQLIASNSQYHFHLVPLSMLVIDFSVLWDWNFFASKDIVKKKQSYGPHLIPSQKTFMCSSLPFFSLAFSLLPSTPFALLFFVSELKSDQNTDVMDLCSAFGHAEWLSALFFSHRTASSYCARRPLRESRPNYQSRGA